MKIDLKKGNIKIADIVIVISVILVIIMVFLFGYLKNMKTDYNGVVITYKNEVLEEVYFDSKTYEYKIEVKDNVLYLFKDSKEIKKINVNNTDDFINVIKIEGNSVKMIEASCKNKDCMDMYITESHKLPIICTNGISVSIKDNNKPFDELS